MKIQTLEIFTKKLEQQTHFYHQVLGLEILEKSEHAVSFQTGSSILKLVYNESFTPYHFAFNIPANKAEETLKWLKRKVNVLKEDELELHTYEPWNAQNIYFYDSENNIVEFIARKNLKNNSHKSFDSNSILNISEIGLPAQDINIEYDLLKTISNIEIYDGSTKRFCAIGDEEGMFIVINKLLKKQWFPTEDKPFSSPFIIEFQEKGKDFKFAYRNEILKQIV